MGFSLQVDTDDAQPLASNQGWADLLNWVASLPDGEGLTLRHLGEYGWTGKVSELTSELSAALEDHVPGRADVRDTAENLLQMLKAADGAEVVSVTDGLGSKSMEETRSVKPDWGARSRERRHAAERATLPQRP
jgi:hypothetical protein